MQLLNRFVNACASRFVLPLLPSKKKLAWHYRLAVMNGLVNECRFIDRIGPNRGIAVDAGANLGLYTYRLSELYDQVIAFDANPEITKWIAARNAHNVTLIPKGLSSTHGTTTLYMPEVAGRDVPSWASLYNDNCPAADRLRKIEVEVIPLDSLNLPSLEFMKIDVEGHEVELLKGASETIAKFRPAVLIESKETYRLEVQRFFSKLNYKETNFKGLTNLNGGADDFIYLP